MPTGFTPIYRIEKDGVDITDRFNSQSVLIEVNLMSVGSSDTFRITIDDRDFRLAEVDPGAWLSVALGYEEVGMSYMGLFEINKVVYEGPPKQISIEGTSAGMDSALKGQAIKEFDNKSVQEIVDEIAKAGGIQGVVHGLLGSKKIPFKNQAGISPFHLLHELERHFDAVAKFQDGKLVVVPRDDGESVSGKTMASVILQPHHFGTWAVTHTERPRYDKVKAPYWDKDQHKTQWVEEKNTARPQTDGGGGGEDTIYRLNRKYNSKDEAETAVKSRMAMLRRSSATAEVTLAKGDPWIKDQMKMVITGMRPGVDGTYTIEQAKHTYTKDTGLMTTLVGTTAGEDEAIDAERLQPENFISPDRIDPKSGRVAGSV